MNESPLPPDLQVDEAELLARYRAHRPRAPAALGSRVQAAAAVAASPKPGISALRRWPVPLALAATLVLAIGVTRYLRDDDPVTTPTVRVSTGPAAGLDLRYPPLVNLPEPLAALVAPGPERFIEDARLVRRLASNAARSPGGCLSKLWLIPDTAQLAQITQNPQGWAALVQQLPDSIPVTISDPATSQRSAMHRIARRLNASSYVIDTGGTCVHDTRGGLVVALDLSTFGVRPLKLRNQDLSAPAAFSYSLDQIIPRANTLPSPLRLTPE
ncbi:MAG: hypothetical protein EPN60_17225 [Nevskiaceae bacterium]|nr:MAG: hypothetical protein EPO48_11060 [Nevskiaceae bacterium]TAM22254.1 MAG: hypothetical protein EPN60_17225 [Nevskiaceae bacterium]